MTVQVIAGPPASGKTEWLIGTIQDQFRSGPQAKVTVILPAHAQENQFRQRLASQGGYFGVEILNLTKYCRMLLDKHHRLFKEATFSMKQRQINDSIVEMLGREAMGELATIAGMPGFKSVLVDRFSQLMLAGVHPDDSRFSPFCEADPQLATILALYGSYWQRCWQSGWLDGDWLVAFTLGLLEKSEIQPELRSLIVVDGFEHFNPVHLRLLQSLEPACQRMLISLPLEVGNASLVYARPQSTLVRLQESFPNMEVSSPDAAFFLPASLAALGSTFHQDAQPQTVDTEDKLVKMLAVQSPRAEVREGLRWLKKKLLEEDDNGNRLLNFSDCVIVAPQEDVYRDLLKSTAFEFGMPLHFSIHQKLGQQPAIMALLNMLQLPLEDYKRRTLLDVIRSPFFDLKGFGLHQEDALILEILSRKELIMSGWERWREVLTQLQRVTPVQDGLLEEEEAHFNIDLLNAADAERLLAGLEHLFSLFMASAESHPLSYWLSWLRTLIINVSFHVQNSLPGEDLEKTLNELILVETEMGISTLSYAQLVQELTSLWQATATSQDSAQQNAVLVLRLPEVRAKRFACVVVHGLAEGVLPRIEREDPFLPEDFRAALGLERQLQKDQAGQFFQLITRADRALLVTRPYLNDKGESLEPSPYWNEMAVCLNKECIETIRPAQKRPLTEAASLSEALLWSGLYGYDSVAISHPDFQKAAGLVHWQRQIFQHRQETINQGEYEGNLGGLLSPLDRMLSTDSVWSASRLETYLACPMRFWVNYALDAKELAPPEPGVLPNQTGSILHEILEKVYRDYFEEDLETILANLQKVARDVFRDAPRRYNFAPNLLWEIQQEEWLPALQQTIIGLASAEWHPYRFEQKFGAGDLPVLRIVLMGGKTIRIHGTIDRIDRNSARQIRVIDYKTGASHLAAKDLLNGSRIQLPIYARAASDSLELGDVVDGFYWAILSGQESNLKLSNFEFETVIGPQAAQMVLEAHLGDIVSGIETGNFAPTPPADNCPDYCAASRWCWHYRPAWRK